MNTVQHDRLGKALFLLYGAELPNGIERDLTPRLARDWLLVLSRDIITAEVALACAQTAQERLQWLKRLRYRREFRNHLENISDSELKGLSHE